jgi:pimeloyl-ACP methyl ester carboxylesterase
VADGHLRASGYVDRQPAGTRIYWEEFGNADAPPVVVLHAGLTSIAFMGGQIETLAAESYRVIAIDSRGHGKSSNTAPVPTYEMMTDDVIAVMNARKIAKADVVGWSDGGNIGLDLARRYPGRVRKLVAFGANHTPPPDGQDGEMTREFKEAKADAGMFLPLRYLYQKNSPTPDKWSEFLERERAMVFAGPNWSLAELSTIRAPVLLLNGEHDLVLLPYARSDTGCSFNGSASRSRNFPVRRELIDSLRQHLRQLLGQILHRQTRLRGQLLQEVRTKYAMNVGTPRRVRWVRFRPTI